MKTNARNMLIDLKLLVRNRELYYFFCHKSLHYKSGEIAECKPKMYKLACLQCFFSASKALWVYRRAKNETA